MIEILDKLSHSGKNKTCHKIQFEYAGLNVA